jgi:hypothetical protein
MAQTTKARPKSKARTQSKARSKATQKPRSQSRSSSNGSHRSNGVAKVQQPIKEAGQAVGGAMSKAKVPLLAGGAALAGAAGGLALGTRQARRGGIGARALSRRPQVKVRSQDLAKAAKEVGSFGAQVGRLASELHQAREATGNDSGTHRSPVEVVLDGLTARRSRG